MRVVVIVCEQFQGQNFIYAEFKGVLKEVCSLAILSRELWDLVDFDDGLFELLKSDSSFFEKEKGQYLFKSSQAKDDQLSIRYHCILASSQLAFESSRLQNYYLVNEIYSLLAYSIVCERNLCLACKHLIPNLSPLSSKIWPLIKHQLVSNSSNSIIVYTKRMILPEQNLWCHIPRRTTSLMRILCLPVPCNSKISNTTVPIFIKYDILRFDIPMDNIVVMQIFQPVHDTSDYPLYYYYDSTYLLLIEHALSVYIVPQISTFKVVYQQVEIFSVLKCAVHIHNKRMIKFTQNLALIQY